MALKCDIHFHSVAGMNKFCLKHTIIASENHIPWEIPHNGTLQLIWGIPLQRGFPKNLKLSEQIQTNSFKMQGKGRRLRPKYMFFVYFFVCFDIALSDFCYPEQIKSYRVVFPADNNEKRGKMTISRSFQGHKLL